MKDINLVLNSEISIDELAKDDEIKGHHFVSKFIEPGVAHYDNLGDVLITKETLNKIVPSIVGCPVIINHTDITPENVEQERVGVVSEVEYDQYSGWFVCSGVIWDKQAIGLIKNDGWNVSCAYKFKTSGEPVMYHGKQVDMEFIDGDFQHLAIVKTPRYEGANIAINSKDTEDMEDLIIENGGAGSGDFDHADKTAENGFITLDAGTENERVIWIPFGKKYLSKKAKKRVIDIINNHKQGEEPKFDFSHTRVKPSNEQVNYLKDTINEISKEYNFKGLAQVEISSELNNGSIGVCVSTNNGSVVSLSPQIYSGKFTQENWDKSVKEGFHPKGTGEMIKSILTHEIGHAITCDNVNNDFWEEIEPVRKDYLKNIKTDDIKNADYISKYARTNKYEFVAEAFCQGKLAKKYGRYTSKVMDIIKNHFGNTKQMKLALNDKENERQKTDITFIEEFGRGYPIDEETFEKWTKEDTKKTDKSKNNVENSTNKQLRLFNGKDTVMTVLNELKSFVLDIVQNAKDDKRAGIDKVAGIMKSAGCDDEDIRTAIGIMEKVAYDKSEAGTADNKCAKNAKEDDKKEVCNEDKRKLIDEIGGILKGQKLDDEIIRTVIGKAEEIAYNPSETDKADNCGKAKNEKEEIKEEIKEDKKEVKNSLDDVSNILYKGSQSTPESSYMTRAERLELGNKF